MTVLNTAEWLLGCSSPSPASASKDYGTEVHACDSIDARKDFSSPQSDVIGFLFAVL